MFSALSRLTHLTKLTLRHIMLDLAKLGQAYRHRLPSVRSLSLTLMNAKGPCTVRYTIGSAVCGIISDLFPNLQKLALGFSPYFVSK